ncbi:circadian clock protein KaiC [Desulfococcaceae bacterium HSG9]|nr:circadian clock protein KaiC [Desulfococcaceae bacterium HSG9]
MTESENTTAKQFQLPKVETQIRGLDEVLHGGLPAGRVTLVRGKSGCGKTVMSLEFLYRGALAGEAGIFIAFEESAEQVRQNALTMGWDLARLEKENTLFILDARPKTDVIISQNFDAAGLLAIIAGKAEEMNCRRIVIDALDAFITIFDDPAKRRLTIRELHSWVMAHNLTAILTMKSVANSAETEFYEFLSYLSDCVISLDQRIFEQLRTRRLTVKKYRGSDFSSSEHSFVVSDNGIMIITISPTQIEHHALGQKISTGLPRLDTIMDGGYRQSACVLLSGSSGTGKTTFVNMFAQAACSRGEHVLYIAFEESAEAIMGNMRSVGIDLQQATDSGRLCYLAELPESMGVEEHLAHAFELIRTFQPQHIIVDAISACKRMGSEKQFFDYLFRLVNHCKRFGKTCVLANQGNVFIDDFKADITNADFSSLLDTVVFLRYVEVGGEINRTLLVAKSRGSQHSNQYREYRITDNGIDILDVYLGKGGVLTGAARQEQEAAELAEFETRRQTIDVERLEIRGEELLLQQTIAAMEAKLKARRTKLAIMEENEQIQRDDRNIRSTSRGSDNNSLVLEQDKGGLKYDD